MDTKRLLGSILLASSLTALGCGEDVGACKSEKEGRETVLVNNTVQYAGQAIINQSCANNICHSSAVKGEARNGAPAGLDFNLRPATADGEDETEDGTTIATLTDSDLAGLRKRQRKVVEQRNRIWQQVRDGLMPPPGMFAQFRKLARVFFTDESELCTGVQSTSFAPITAGESQEVLREWLACGAPIVETNTELVTKREVGTIGYQYPSCGGELPEGNTLEAVQARIFDVYCADCHPDMSDPDLRSVEASFASLLEDDSEICDGKPYVTKGDSSASYLYDLVSKDDPGCHARMPLGGELSEEEMQLIKDWIDEGALREGE